MKTDPSILDYGRGNETRVPLTIESLPSGFRIVISGRGAGNVIALIGWLIVCLFLFIQLLMTREWIGITFLAVFLIPAGIALIMSIQNLRGKSVEYADGILSIVSPIDFRKRTTRCSLLGVRDIYAWGESLRIRMLDGRELPSCKLGSEENVQAILQILREMLPRRAELDE